MRKRHAAGQTIGLLRQMEVELAQGRSLGGICRVPGVLEASYCRWRSGYGGLKMDQARRLERAVPGLTQDKLILKEAAEESF